MKKKKASWTFREHGKVRMGEKSKEIDAPRNEKEEHDSPLACLARQSVRGQRVGTPPKRPPFLDVFAWVRAMVRGWCQAVLRCFLIFSFCLSWIFVRTTVCVCVCVCLDTCLLLPWLTLACLQKGCVVFDADR
ncbi:uncharacterized protein B0I36DRAFT_30719 [Microdochium trichocladiopsis]|uniref:Transmembrane protein n=1 Tax=Microdochium trichocladiopsis TaxID=1682393 RepID=A0A9P8XZ79_9PEZI|nr:uncharacterized protein B0I36DRAFT_30719 [Microdochium trichocladiopsis]KAH7021263.1 hypothetical protein B0I36DRAFT_30719 [Microdochium trichocladiopsis]